MSNNTMTIVQIQAALGIPITATFITDVLEIKPVEQQKRALFWSHEQWGLIRGRLTNYLNGRNQHPKEFSGERPPKKEKEDAAPAGDIDAMFGDEAPNATSNEDFFA